MSHPLVQRRHAEVLARWTSLEAELEHWRLRTQNGPLARHRSQVRRLSSRLQGLLDPVRAELASPASSRILGQARRWESAILAAHTLWEFFRSKLLLRESPHFGQPLALCDDLAWACYRPARDAFGTAPPREPPLVYLNALWSPFAMPRGGNFAAEIRPVPGLGTALGSDAFRQALDQLPIPLVGLPWYHTSHLPAALLIAHEIGHVVAWDFSLDADIQRAIDHDAGLDAARAESWSGWRDEIFADFYAVCATGPAFLGALVDLLAAPPAEIRAETGAGAPHPPRALRVALAGRMLREIGFENDALRLEADWASACGSLQETSVARFAADLQPLARALRQARFHGRTLADVITPPSGSAETLANKVRDGFPIPGPLDVREAVAGARWVQENRSTTELEAFSRTLRGALAKAPVDDLRGTGTDRSRASDAPTPASRPPDAAARGDAEAAFDREAGRTLFHTMFGADDP